MFLWGVTAANLVLSMLILRVNSAYGSDVNNISSDLDSINSEIKSVRNSFWKKNNSADTIEIIDQLASTLQIVLSELAQSYSFQQNISSEISELSEQLNVTRCSLSTRIISIENAMNHHSVSEESSVSREKGITNFRSRDFLVTPVTIYVEARKYCRLHNGDPFIPHSQEEFEYLLSRVTADSEYGWLPLTDLLVEESAEWDDNTDYANGFQLSFADTDSKDGNEEGYDCVDVNSKGNSDWYSCNVERPLLCMLREE